jgi:hypothetical protein
MSPAPPSLASTLHARNGRRKKWDLELELTRCDAGLQISNPSTIGSQAGMEAEMMHGELDAARPRLLLATCAPARPRRCNKGRTRNALALLPLVTSPVSELTTALLPQHGPRVGSFCSLPPGPVYKYLVVVLRRAGSYRPPSVITYLSHRLVGWSVGRADGSRQCRPPISQIEI